MPSWAPTPVLIVFVLMCFSCVLVLTKAIGRAEWLRHSQVVVSLHRGASTYAYGQFPWYTARKPTIGDSPLTLLSHMPTIRESVPSDHRTKRCRRGSEPIVYGSRPCNFCRGGQSCRVGGVSFSKGSDPGSILSKVLRDFLPIHLNSPKKFHN